MADQTPVQRFYMGGHILVTGGTGFLGKVLLEKLLWSCSGIERIYILIRPKKGLSSEVRLRQLLEDPVFDRVRGAHPDFSCKIEAIPGDCSEPNLGISPEIQRLLQNKVTVVFHVAATVKFHENIKRAVAINIIGTKNLLNICEQMKCLKAFVYASTAYSNCKEKVVREIFYPPPHCKDRIEEIVAPLTEEQAGALTLSLLGDWPNTYTFTKAIAESYIHEKAKARTIPICIIRPAIVTASLDEPFPGWIDNINGATGILLQGWLGICKVMIGNRQCYANLVPVDLTVNVMIVAAKETHALFLDEPGNTRIYNLESNSTNPVKWGPFLDATRSYTKSMPSEQAVGHNSVYYTQHYSVFSILSQILHIIPGHVYDFFTRMSGGKPKMLRHYENIRKFQDTLAFFSLRTFHYNSTNVRALIDASSSEDRKMFNMNLCSIDWPQYARNYIKGIKQFIMKEPMDDLKKAKTRYKRLYYFYFLSRTLTTASLFYFIAVFILRISKLKPSSRSLLLRLR